MVRLARRPKKKNGHNCSMSNEGSFVVAFRWEDAAGKSDVILMAPTQDKWQHRRFLVGSIWHDCGINSRLMGRKGNMHSSLGPSTTICPC